MARIAARPSRRARAFLLSCALVAAGIARTSTCIRAGVAVSGLVSSDQDFRPYIGYEVATLQQVGYPLYGPQVGVSWDVPLSSFFSVQPELGFVRRGYHLNQIALYNSSYKIRISYLELPLLVRVGLPRGRVRPGLTLGPYAAYRLGAAGRLMDLGDVETRRLSTVSGFDYGLVLGIDTEVSVGRGRLLFDVRLNRGLADVMREGDGYTALHEHPGRVHVLSLALMSGYRF